RAAAGHQPLLGAGMCRRVRLLCALHRRLMRLYSFLARRRAISDARRRFLDRVRENFNRLSEWSTDGPVPPSPPAVTPPASVTTADRVDEPPPPPVATTPPGFDVPPPPPVARTATCDDMPQPLRAAPARPARGDTSNSGLGNCPVCLEPLHGRTNIMAAHECAHVFHASCVEPWLHNRGSCPVCQYTGIPTPTTTSTTNSTPTSDTIGYCPVCLEPLRAGSGDIRAAHACGHVFHSRCIERWVRRRGSCPVCRCTVRFNPNSTYNPASISTFNPTTNTNPTYNPTPTPTPNSTSNSGPVGECPVCASSP
uniref:RING-type domain-containing protein n=1 Tax=Aegilops tauschii subsp. strangulata TaxID=200361 RepID=A0A453J8G8_AEGTS